MEANEKPNETLISLLAAKELELKQMLLYIQQLEKTYNDLCERYNELMELHFRKKKRTIGFKQQKK